MRTIEYIFTEEDLEGVENISLVDGAAQRTTFLALSEKKNATTVDKERRMVIGPVLTPGMIKGNPSIGEKGFISPETVRMVMENFIKKGKNGNINIHHDESLEGCYVVQNWQVDRKNGINAGYGMDDGAKKVPDGTWMSAMKIDNNDVWENDVKAGEVNGFSIEANFKKVPVHLSEKNTLSDSFNNIKEIANKIWQT